MTDLKFRQKHIAKLEELLYQLKKRHIDYLLKEAHPDRQDYESFDDYWYDKESYEKDMDQAKAHYQGRKERLERMIRQIKYTPSKYLWFEGGLPQGSFVPNRTGIYGVLCVPTGHIYVGQSISMRWRVKGHLSDLRYGSHPSGTLQADYDEYGERNILCSVLEFVDEEWKLHYIESKWQRFFGDRIVSIEGRGAQAPEVIEAYKRLSSRISPKLQVHLFGWAITNEDDLD